MRLKQKCAKCGIALVYFRMVLMMGPKGFRSYACCDKCADKVAPTSTTASTPPPRTNLGEEEKVNFATDENVKDLIYTSVDDMVSSLGCNQYALPVLQAAFDMATRRGMKTKAGILGAKIKKMEKTPIALSGTSPKMGEEERGV